MERKTRIAVFSGSIIIASILFTYSFFTFWLATTPQIIEVQIQVQSDTSWMGNIGSLEEGDRSIEGNGDKSFTVTGTIITAYIQKQTSIGFLQVSIIKDGRIMKQQQTTAQYGGVMVSVSA